MRRFKLTAAFLVVSALALAMAAVVILKGSSDLEERNIAGLMTEQSVRDARLIAGAVSRMLSGDATPGAAGGNVVEISSKERDDARSTISEFLGGSDIVRLALYETDGRSAWSSDERRVPISGRSAELFREAAGGVITSGLMRGKQLPGMPNPVDVVETYIPFLGLETDDPVRVLGVTRDVTAALSLRIGETRSAMFRVTLVSIGGGFLLLLGFIVIADRAMWRSRERELCKQRELSDHQIVSTRLDIENRELQRLNDERENLIGHVSHELRTPLTSVLAFTDILMLPDANLPRSKNQEYLGVIKRSGSQLLEMIDEMLDVSRLESRESSLDETEFDVSVLVSEAGQKIDPIIRMKRQKLQVFGDIDGCWIRADRGRLDQVLMNLLSNASKYSPEGTAIQLEVTAGTSELRITVRDEGIGIAEKDRNRIFDKFFRVDREETRTVPGTGLGLAIVKSIIDLHGGEISVTSRFTRGTMFSLRIPAAVRRPQTSREVQAAVHSRIDLTGRRALRVVD